MTLPDSGAATKQEEHATAIVLIKCARGAEGSVADSLDLLHQNVKCEGKCYFQGKKKKAGEAYCKDVRVSEAAFSFGPFDFFVTVQAADVGQIEEFVVSCLRASEQTVLDTQTLVGIPLRNRRKR